MGINISVNLADSLEQSSVHVSGFEAGPITDDIARQYGFERQGGGGGRNDAIWGAINQLWGRFPNAWFTSDPVTGLDGTIRDVPKAWTPYADTSREAKQVLLEKRPVAARIIQVTGSPDSLATSRSINELPIPTPEEIARGVTNIKHDHVALSHNNAVQHARSSEKGWSLDVTNNIGVELGGDSFGGKVSRSLSISFGTHASERNTETVTQTREVARSTTIPVPPRTVLLTSLLASTGACRIEVDFECALSGYYSLYYHKPLRAPNQIIFAAGHIRDVLAKAGLPYTQNVTETLEIGFVTDGTLDTKPLDETPEEALAELQGDGNGGDGEDFTDRGYA